MRASSHRGSSLHANVVTAGFLLVIFLSLVPVMMRGADAIGVSKEWTTTADFNAGTKSSSDGNFQVETVTDNPGIDANRIELGSIKGDSFAFADADANTWRWDLAQFDAGSCASRAITGGTLQIQITQNSYSACGVASRGTVSGDWEVSMKETDLVAGGGRRATICVQTLKSYCGDTAGGNYGVMMFITVDTIFRAFKEVAGVVTQIGGDTTIGAQTTAYLRILRETQYFHFLYSLDGILWVQIQQVDLTAAAIPSSLYMVIQAENNGATDGTTSLDDFKWSQPYRSPGAAGTGIGDIDLGGYQTSGTWLSPGHDIGGTLDVEHIVLSTEKLTATENVDFVSLYSNGTLKETWTDDLTSGTLHLYNVTVVASYNITVEIGLKGIGSGTPVVTAVGLVFQTSPSGIPPPPLSAAFHANPSGGDAPLNITFTSVVTGGTPNYTYAWTFGDGGTSTAANPFHVYTHNGTYIITLVVTDSSTPAQTATATVTLVVGSAGVFIAFPANGFIPTNLIILLLGLIFAAILILIGLWRKNGAFLFMGGLTLLLTVFYAALTITMPVFLLILGFIVAVLVIVEGLLG